MQEELGSRGMGAFQSSVRVSCLNLSLAYLTLVTGYGHRWGVWCTFQESSAVTKPLIFGVQDWEAGMEEMKKQKIVRGQMSGWMGVSLTCDIPLNRCCI